MNDPLHLPQFNDDANWGPIDEVAFTLIAKHGLTRLQMTLPVLISQLDPDESANEELFDLLAILGMWIHRTVATSPKFRGCKTERDFTAALVDEEDRRAEASSYQRQIIQAIEQWGRYARDYQEQRPYFLKMLWVARRDRPPVLLNMNQRSPEMALLVFLLLNNVPEFVEHVETFFRSGERDQADLEAQSFTHGRKRGRGRQREQSPPAWLRELENLEDELK